MPLPGSDGSVGHSFGVEFDGVPIKNIIEVSGLRRLPGRHKAGEVTLTRGLTHDAAFETWIEEVSAPSGDAGRRGTIVVFDLEGRAIKRYGVVHARPRSLEIGTVKAGDTSVVVERLELTYDSLEIS